MDKGGTGKSFGLAAGAWMALRFVQLLSGVGYIAFLLGIIGWNIVQKKYMYNEL